MPVTGEGTIEGLHDVTVALSGAQLAWLSEAAAAHRPPLEPPAVLGRLVDEAIAAREVARRRRAEQLEVYRASGYAEHHPDYPLVPRAHSDV